MGALKRHLVRRALSWYHTPQAQAAALGVVFFFVFAAYTTIQFYSASTYGADLAADSVSAIYLAFTVTCLFSPAIINKWGCRLSMFVGILGYSSLVLASLIYFLYGGKDVRWARWLLVAAGAVLGCGASILWTAQGRLILQYASKAEELESSGTTQMGGEKMQTGKLLGLFWAIFQCSSLVGGTISFIYYGQKPQGSTGLYALFLAFLILGALSTQLLLPPSMLGSSSHERGDATIRKQKDLEMITEQTPLTVDSNADYDRADSRLTDAGSKGGEEMSNQSWLQEAQETLKLFATEKMVCLSILFFYTGFNQPYQQATFGNRFFTRRTIGAELIIFHLMEIVGGIVSGWWLDNGGINCRQRATLCLGAFVIINGAGNVLAAVQEYDARESGLATAHDIADLAAISPSLAFACWGFADAQIQVYCYWLMGSFYTSGSQHARAVGFYKLVQSLGTSVGFFLIPASRLEPLSQLVCSSLVFIAGTGLSTAQSPNE
ncbi:hypothetical protein ACHAXT_004312 [Thalassiosira profunda]